MEKIIGINPVLEALKNRREIEYIEIYKGINKNNVKEIVDFSKKYGVKLKYTEIRDKQSQGVIAYTGDYNYAVEHGEFLEKVVNKEYSTVLILDNIQDPRNFGALIRSAEAFGVDAIYVPERNSVRINETVIKTSTGAIEYVDIVVVSNLNNAIEDLKKIGYWVYGAEANGTKEYFEEKYPKKTAMVLGSEGKGLRTRVKSNCDIILSIPMLGKINSLNVSVAGGILLAEISKNRRV